MSPSFRGPRRRVLLSAALVAFWALLGSTARAAPYFEDKPAAFGSQPCANTGCWTNYLQIVDLDGDGDLDVVMPNADGYFTKGPEAQPLLVYLNDGAGNFTNGSQAMVGGTSGWFRQVAFADLNGDGKLDMYVPDAWGASDKLFINKGNGTMVDEAATRLPGLKSHAGAARFGDVDNDGDLDLLVSDSWTNEGSPIAHLYINDGTGKFTESAAALPTKRAGNQAIDIDFFDADGDFDLDVMINLHTGTNSLWLNDGKGTFTLAPFPKSTSDNFRYGPVACDVDGDGDLDVAIDNTGASGLEQLLINDGKGAFTDETAARITGNVAFADDNGLACIDVDGDGDFDLAISSLSDVERVLINDGTGHFMPSASPAFTAISDSTLGFDFGDLDGDGRLDAVTGQGESGSFIDRVYLGTALAPVDTRAPGFRAVEQVSAKVNPSARPVVRFAVFDNTTTDTGPRLKKAYVKVTAEGATTEISAVFMGGDLFRAALPARGKSGVLVSYEVCATDRRGNDACAKPKTYVTDGAVTLEDGGTPDPDGGGSSGTSGTTPNGDDPGGSTTGCGCTIPAGHGGALGLASLVAIAAIAARRRARTARR